MAALSNCFLFLAYLALFSSVNAYTPLSFVIEQASSSAHASQSFSAYSAAGIGVSTVNENRESSSKAVHVPLKARNKLAGRPKKRLQTVHNGVHVDTIDAVVGGCPSLDFSAQVTVGGQSFQMIIDTGSTTLGVASSFCSCGANTNPLYTPGTTATILTNSSQAFSSEYGDGSVWYAAGASDMVSMSGSLAARTTFALITQESNFFQSTTCGGAIGSPMQGILGFAGPGIAVASTDGTHVVAQQWFAQYRAAANVPNIFAVQMCMLSGDIWLGGYDNSTFSGQLHWLSIQSLTATNSNEQQITLTPGQGYYTVFVESIGLEGRYADTNSADFQGVNVNTIVDTGTTIMVLPTAAYTDIVGALIKNYNSVFVSLFGVSATTFFTSHQCYTPIANIQTMNEDLPPLSVVLGGAANGVSLNITLNAASSYLQQTVIAGVIYFCTGVDDRGTSTTNVLGWSFMNQLIVVHDLQNMKLGFGVRSGCTDGSVGAVSVTGGETNIIDPAIAAGTVTTIGAAGSGTVPTNPPTNFLSNVTRGLSTTYIIIIVVCIVAGLGILVALFWCCRSHRRNVKETMQAAIEKQQEQEFGTLRIPI